MNDEQSTPLRVTIIDPVNCECFTWASDYHVLTGVHHYNCPRAAKQNLAILRAKLEALVIGIEQWAALEDGIAEEAWTAYEEACLMLGRPVSSQSV